MQSSEIDVLNLEWSSKPSRDRQMATLICNYLRYQGLQVVEGSLFNGYALIKKYKPKLVFIVDTGGADINFMIMKYAKSKGIKGVSLVAEGNFRDSSSSQFIIECIWGWNKEQIKYEDFYMMWSERTKSITTRYFPELDKKIKISGGVGFDLYQIVKPKDRNEFLKKYNKDQYQKVIGFGCWDFGHLYPSDHRHGMTLNSYKPEIIERLKKDRDSLHAVLKKSIEQNPGILFLLKEHPGTIGGRYASAIEELENYPNTLILKTEAPIVDCIAVSDFWMVFDSTTAMEAWLLGKQSGLLNPSGVDFPRDNVHLGSPNFPTYESFQAAIDNFYGKGELPGFKQSEDQRDSIIMETIQWKDGLNHVRAGNEIIELLQIKDKDAIVRSKNHLSGIWDAILQKLLWNLSSYLKFLPLFSFYYQRKLDFNEQSLALFSQSRFKEQLEFYSKLSLTKEALKRYRCL